jgi:DNA polymerase III subunit delta'
VSDVPEIDRLEGTPHPRETTMLIGQSGAERMLREAYGSGRMHHAWILAGGPGIGKATLAYRMAKFALSQADPALLDPGEDLSVPPDATAARQIVAQAHPDLMVLRRVWNGDRKTFFAEIRVDDVRRLRSFFGSTAGQGGWRIAVVDRADDLNTAGANALLKVLEEPPPKSLFLIVAERPGRLLPTIRSRCRLLRLEGLTEADAIRAALLARPDLDPGKLSVAAGLAQGSVRRSIELAEGEGAALHAALYAILSRLPDLDVAAAHALADRCSSRGHEGNFALLLGFIEDWLHQRILEAREEPAARLARWSQVWEKSRQAAREVEDFNLDRKPFLLSTLSMLARASRS